MTSWGTLGLQNGVSPLMEQLIFFHDHSLVILITVTILVGYMMVVAIMNSFTNRILLESQFIEVIWTILPAIVLVFVAFPSLRLLYLLDEVNSPSLTIKIMGHQWFWSYEYTDFLDLEFESYLNPLEEMKAGSMRLLEVDNRTIIPVNTQIRGLISAIDVIHSWTVPSIGVKVDAIPGRLNQISFLCKFSGLFYGQCSEICGANHSFMPIVLESVNLSSFFDWVNR